MEKLVQCTVPRTTVAVIAPITFFLVLSVLNVPRLRAQAQQATPAPLPSFEVASVKLDNNPDVEPSGESPAPTGSFYSLTKQPVGILISIAYDRPPNGYFYGELMHQLPKWAQSERFDIEARVAGNPTKEQLHLMLRSLLADRFKLAMHYEIRQVPIYNLVLVKTGKLGPNVRPFGNEEPCPTSRPSSPTVAGGFPTVCGAPHQLEPSKPGLARVGFRNVSMEWFSANAAAPDPDRPVFDHTGLTGTFDLIMEYDRNASNDPTAVPAGPTRIEAMRDQLGLKLESAIGPVKTFIIDHIEQPSPN